MGRQTSLPTPGSIALDSIGRSVYCDADPRMCPGKPANLKNAVTLENGAVAKERRH